MKISEYAKEIGVENYTLKEALDKIEFSYEENKETN